jgi:hypothetical protein
MTTYLRNNLRNCLLTLAVAFIGIAIGRYTAPQPVACESGKIVLTIPNEGYSIVLPPTFTHAQSELLDLAYQTAKADHLPHPQLLQGILMQETLAGALAGYKVAGQEAGLKPNQRYYGVYQIKLAAARDVLKRFPELWAQYGFQTRMDEEVIAQLIENDAFSTAVASKYLVILSDSGYHTAGALAVAYNKGPGGAMGVNVSADPYAVGVSRHVARLAPVEPDVYHVLPGDSLGKIATALHLNWHELYDANPEAFVGGDPNVLMANVDIKLPNRRG